jgi:hypothetical protein
VDLRSFMTYYSIAVSRRSSPLKKNNTAVQNLCQK